MADPTDARAVLRAGLAGLLILLVATGATASPAVRPILQRGHDAPPQVAAWLPDGRYLISAGASDVITWDSETGHVVAAQAIPAAVENRFAPIDLGATAAGAQLRGQIATPRDDGDGETSACQTWRFDPAGLEPPQVSVAAGPCALPAPASSRAANGRSWRFDRGDIAVAPGPAGGRAMRLVSAPRDQFSVGAVSPDARFVAQIAVSRTAGGAVTRVASRSLRQGRAFADRRFDGAYGRVQWLDDGRYLLTPWPVDMADPCRAGQPPDTLIVDAASGAVIDSVPTLRQTLLLGTGGAMVGIGPAPCPGRAGRPAPAQLAVRAPGGAWRPLPVAALRGRDVFKLATRPDGSAIAVMTSAPRSSADDPYSGWRITLLPIDASLRPGTARTLPQRFDAPDNDLEAGSFLWGFGIGRDGAILVVGADEQMFCFDTDSGALVRVLTLAMGDTAPGFYSADRTTLLVGSPRLASVEVHDLVSGARSDFAASDLNSAGILPGRNLLWTLAGDGTTHFYDQRSRQLVLTSYRLADGGFFSIDGDGRYDTNQGADSATIRWQMSDRPRDSLPPQMFMRDRYEPDLLPRRLDCTGAGTCDALFPPLAPAERVDRALPAVRVVAVAAGPAPDLVRVTVAAEPGRHDDGTVSPIADLRLLRDNRVVAAWQGRATAGLRRDFIVPVPVTRGGQSVAFSAYGFNADRRKGETSDVMRHVPPALPRPRRAFVLTIGIDQYAIPGRDLAFAGADAEALAAALARIDGYRVHQMALLGRAAARHASRALIRAAIGLLAGTPGPWRRQLQRAGVAGVADFGTATPDDIVIIAWSGHGVLIAGGDGAPHFALVPGDARLDDNGAIAPAGLVSADDLADWLRPLAAGEAALIIDACHSGASVTAGGFKPGPMGDRGLGQLAFDKGLRILAATQAEDVAREGGARGLGLLTATLIDAGLGGSAPGTADGWVRLDDVLRHAAVALPERQAAEAARRAGAALPPLLVLDVAPPPPPPQVPAVFDFTGAASPAWLPAGAPGTGPP